jgi:hypothetical protein
MNFIYEAHIFHIHEIDLLPADAEEPVVREASVTSVFVPVIEAALAEYVSKWQDRSEGENLIQAHDPELVREELRPLVFEEVRQQVHKTHLAAP